MTGRGTLPSKILEIYKLVEGLQERLNSASREESDFLSKALEEFKVRLKELSAAGEENERHLRDAERKASELNATISSIADGVITYGPNGEITSMNATARELLGFSPEDFNRMTPPERMRLMKVKTAEGKEQEPGRSPIVRALKGETIRGEVRVIENPRDGRVIWTDNSAAPMYSADGRLQGAVATFTDITERKRIEEELRESEEKSRDLIRHAPSGIFEVDFHGPRFKSINDAMCQYLGYNREELLSMDPFDLLDDKSKNIFQERIRKKLAGENIDNSVEYKVKAKDGREYYAVLHITFTYKNGKAEGAVVIAHDITERKRVEKALREREAELRLVADGVPLLLAHIGLDLRYLFVNQSYANWFGLPKEKIIGRHISEILSQEGYKGAQPAIKMVLAGEKATFNLVVQRDGQPRALDIAFIPQLDEHGRVRSYYTITQDITERKRAEETLRQSEERFAFAMEATHDGLWDWDIRSGNVYYSPSYFTILGYAADEFAASVESWLGLMHPDDLENALRANQDCIEGRCESFEVEFRMQTKSGDWKWIVGRGRAATRDAHGKATRLVGTHVDITERKRADYALRESKQRFRDAIDNFPNVFVIYDGDRRIQFVNSKGLEIMGLSEQDMVGRKDEEIFPPEMIDSYLPALKHAIETKTPQMLERTRPARMGGQTIIINIIPLLNERGEIRQILGISHDITERKQMEEKLRRSKGELEQRVQERTAELSHSNEELEVVNEELQVELTQHERLEKDLITAKEAAEEAVRVKAAFMANMSHELRTPMNAVIGMTSLLLDEKLTLEQKDYVETIRSGGESLMALINDILDFSKMEREKTEIDLQDIDLRQCVEEALDLLAKNASEKDIDLAYIFEEGMPEAIIGDPARLRQVLVNLLSNAIKFTGHGEVVLTVAPEQNGKIHFSVRDTGIGIPSDKMNLLFLPFSQVDPSITRGYDGAGLGLAISKKLVELMGGEIWAQSDLGKGSTFHFTIKGETVSAKPKPFLGTRPSLEGKSVLIIEDKRATRRILGQQILSWDMIPTIASSTEEVPKLVRGENAYDAVILDVSMSGAEDQVEEIHRRGLPLIALTSVGQHVDSKFGASISKPVKPAQIYSALSKILIQKNQELQTITAEEKTNYGPLHILLAEDNVSNRKVTLQMLRKLGYRANAVSNGLEAIEALKRQHYDVVLMDVKMPVMNGVEATREIRRLWPDNGPKIIALTAYALAGDREKCLDAGMDGYLSKPIQLNDMADILTHQAI